MEHKQFVFSGHAIRQMFSRGLRKTDILAVIKTGEIIADYPDDKPYPSYLMLGFIQYMWYLLQMKKRRLE